MNQTLTDPATSRPDARAVSGRIRTTVTNVLRYLFVRRVTRVRGRGWMVCPNCHERAMQDVTDQITYVSLWFYRLFPWRLQRMLVCLRCQYRRESAPVARMPRRSSGLLTGAAALLALWNFVAGIAAAWQGNSVFSILTLATGIFAAAVATRVPQRTAIAFLLAAIAGIWAIADGLGDIFGPSILGSLSVIEVVLGLVTVAISWMALKNTRRLSVPPLTEVEKLDTAGKRLSPSLMAPIGLGALLILFAGSILAFGGGASAVVGGISFAKYNGGTFIPATFDVPRDWRSEFDDSPAPPRVTFFQTGIGSVNVVLAKPSDVHTLADIISSYYTLTAGLNTQNFPSAPPHASCTTIGGVPAAYVTLDYETQSQQGVTYFYAFIHQGVSYFFSFQGINTPGIDNKTLIKQLADHMVKSVQFTGNEPQSSASATPVSSPTPSPAASPSAGPGLATPAPTPAYSVSCSH